MVLPHNLMHWTCLSVDITGEGHFVDDVSGGGPLVRVALPTALYIGLVSLDRSFQPVYSPSAGLANFLFSYSHDLQHHHEYGVTMTTIYLYVRGMYLTCIPPCSNLA